MKGLPYFYVPEASGPRVALDPADAAHAVRSLRLREGDEVSLSDGAGWVARCRLVQAGRDHAVAEVLAEERRHPPTPRVKVVLAPPKGDRLSWAAQKLTELGVDEIVLAETSRAVRLADADAALDRLRRVVREAAKQSRRAFLPALAVEGGGPPIEPVRGEDWIVLWERATEPLAACLPGRPQTVALFVGPEGGMSEEEALRAERVGAALASLGEQNLRTETAAIAGAAVALHRYGRLG